MAKSLLILLVLFSSTTILGFEARQARKGLNTYNLVPDESKILLEILGPLKDIAQKLLSDQVDDQTRQQLETLFRGIHLDDGALRELSDVLTEEQTSYLIARINEFSKWLTDISELDEHYRAQRKLLVYGGGISGALFAIGCVVTVVLLFEEFAQFGCIKTVCDDPNYQMLFFKHAGHRYHYCAQQGVPYDCLTYEENVVGKHAVVNERLYLTNCTKSLDPGLIGTEIPLGFFHRESNPTCQLVVGLLPLIGLVPSLIEGVVFGGMIVFSSIKANRLECTIRESLRWDQIEFYTHMNGLRNGAKEKLRTWLLLMGKTCHMPGCDGVADILEHWVPYRTYEEKNRH